MGIFAMIRRMTTQKERKRMDLLVYEIIKYRYLYFHCCNPIFTDSQIADKLKELLELEAQFPEHRRDYTPTATAGFLEGQAKQAFGERFWLELKRTWDLLRIEYPDDEG